jgi:hypothetical protein
MGTAIYADSYLMGFFPRTGPDVFVRAKNVGTLATMYPQWWQVNSSPVNYNWDAARSFHISTTSNNGLDFLAAWYDGNSVVYKTTLNNTTPMFRTLKIPTSSNVAVVPYPNPATNQIVLKGAESQEYKLRDMTGRIFGNGTITTNGEISLASLSVGTYTLQVNFKDGNNQVFKIQKL